jgi:hypothetical protein
MRTEADLTALCNEFTNALTEILAENAVGLARRGRVARAHAAVIKHPEYNEHAFCVAVETAFTQWEALQNVGQTCRQRHLKSLSGTAVSEAARVEVHDSLR